MRDFMNEKWEHVFKLDPAKDISDEHLELICDSGTDAIIVGGTDSVTFDNVLDLLSRVRRFSVPCVLEISSIDAVVPGFDYYYIPLVMNSRDKKWMMDIQHEAIKQYKAMIDWDEIFLEGYCVLNESSKVYQKTNCVMPDEEDVIAYACMAEKMFHLPIFYIEYSGTYGNPKLVKEVKEELTETTLFYGGGIETKEQAIEMKQYADVIVVGNVIYENIENALQTVSVKKEKN